MKIFLVFNMSGYVLIACIATASVFHQGDPRMLNKEQEGWYVLKRTRPRAKRPSTGCSVWTSSAPSTSIPLPASQGQFAGFESHKNWTDGFQFYIPDVIGKSLERGVLAPDEKREMVRLVMAQVVEVRTRIL